MIVFALSLSKYLLFARCFRGGVYARHGGRVVIFSDAPDSGRYACANWIAGCDDHVTTPAILTNGDTNIQGNTTSPRGVCHAREVRRASPAASIVAANLGVTTTTSSAAVD